MRFFEVKSDMGPCKINLDLITHVSKLTSGVLRIFFSDHTVIDVVDLNEAVRVWDRLENTSLSRWGVKED